MEKFKPGIIVSAWNRSQGRCECSIPAHEHGPRCNKPLQWHMKDREGQGGWVAMERSMGAAPNLVNCIVMCNECKRKGRGVGF